MNLFKNIKGRIKAKPQGNWFWANLPFILFLTFLAILSIRAGHSVDEKVHKISKLDKELKELQAEYIESKSKLMQLGMESHVVEKAKVMGLVASEKPPHKIVVEVE